MKRVIQFSKGYVIAAIASTAIIAFGLVGYFAKGFNLGVDFQAGINQTVQLAYPVMDVSYSGKGNAVLTVTDQKATIVFSGAEVEGRTVDFSFKDDPTLASLAAAMSAVPEVQAVLRDPAAGGVASSLLVPTFQGNTNLGATPTVLRRAPATSSEEFATTESVRQAMSSLGRVSIQVLKPVTLQRYLIRVQDEGKDPNFSKTAPAAITASLEKAYGADRVVVMKTDYVGAAYSQTLSKQAFWLTFFTVLVILAYATIRFKFQYGIGAVLATVHDMLIMITFIVWTRMEFNATSIAAILTILGYSINDTIVQFDRVREDRRLKPNEPFVDVLNMALTETLSRTIITTLCTMITVIALFIFTTGSLKDFSLALFVGMVSGTYSTIFIASAFVLWWENIKEKRKANELALKAAAVVAKKQQAPVSQKIVKKNAAKKE
jgi:preprotein translocase subunit SecF